MADYVLIISVGPVQGFIAAARRSRDLWSGSWLLSEMAKASAQSLYQQGQTVQLIFPAPHDPTVDLAPDSELSVGNKIQAMVSAQSHDEVANVAKQASNAAKKRFVDVATKAQKEALKGCALRQDVWESQLNDYVETQSAWALIGPAGYAVACEQAARTLAARKATRGFLPSSLDAGDARFMLPKSSLDGARETVLPEGKVALSTRRRLGLADSEQLDCAGVSKRLGGKTDQFTPFSRIAAHAWIQSLTQAESEALSAAYEPLIGLDLATRVSGNNGIYQQLPFDAQLCFPFRLEAAIRDCQKDKDQEATNALLDLQAVLKLLWQSHGQPCAYGVILLADGDKMGELLDKAKDFATHHQVTQALSKFAGGVAAQVRRFDGHSIYAGGDDVLAFVPLNQAYACAKALSEQFENALSAVADSLGADAPTLSVGLGVAHLMTPLGEIREIAKRAEKIAKGNHCRNSAERRNALGVTLAVRSGSVTDLRLRWDDDAAHQSFDNWINAYNDKTITSRVAYDTRAIHLRTEFALDDPELGLKIQQAEFSRMLEKARTHDSSELSKDVKQQLEARVNSISTDLNALSNELIIARWFAAKTQADLGRE